MKFFLLAILLIIGCAKESHLIAQNIVLYEAPEHYQLYPRGDNNFSKVVFCGKISGLDYDSLVLFSYRDDQLLGVDSKSITGEDQEFEQFSFVQNIESGLFQYKFELWIVNEYEKAILYSADSVVCGDAYIITGQSNSHPSSSTLDYSNVHIRSFGVKTGYNRYDSNHKEYRWGKARGDSPDLEGVGGWYTENPFGVGIWGLYLAQMIVENNKVPVCIINGGSGNSTIEENMPANFQSDLNTSFGRLIYRVNEAGLTNGIKAILWHQGESNTDKNYYRYLRKFDTLYLAWKANFPSLEKVYTFQLHPGCGGEFQSEFRNMQVQIADKYEDVNIMSTVSLPGHDGCHYTEEGYFAMAKSIYPLIAKDFYNIKYGYSVTPPKLRSARWASLDKTEICLEFDQAIIFEKNIIIGNSIFHLKDQIFIDGVSGLINEMVPKGKKVFLHLKETGNYSQVTYLPGQYYEGTNICYEGPWILSANGVGALTFDRVIIQ